MTIVARLGLGRPTLSGDEGELRHHSLFENLTHAAAKSPAAFLLQVLMVFEISVAMAIGGPVTFARVT
jgi:hypothetical protein